MSNLYRFVSMGKTELVKQLLDEGCDPNVPAQVKVGRKIDLQMPIERACSLGQCDIFDALINAGAVLPPIPERRNRMLEGAAMAGNIPLLERLRSRGFTSALQNAKQGGNIPLVGALIQGQTKAAIWLLDHGADPNGKIKMGKLQVAPLDAILGTYKLDLSEKMDIAQLLVDRGATPTLQDIEWKWELDHRGPLLAHLRKGQLQDLAQASRPQSNLATPDEALARRSRGRAM